MLRIERMSDILKAMLLRRRPWMPALLATAIVHAETINLHGIVSSAAGQPVSGAVVTLVGPGLKATTGADGSYSITGSTSALPHSAMRAGHAVLSGGVLEIVVTGAMPVRIQVLDTRGRSLRRESFTGRAAEAYQWNLAQAFPAAGVLLIRTDVGVETAWFRYASLGTDGQRFRLESEPIKAARTGDVLAKSAAGVDTVQVTATGYPTRKLEVPAYSMQLDISLVARWDWMGLIETGQSLSVGCCGVPGTSSDWAPITLTTQPFKNLKLSLGSTNYTTDTPPSSYDPNAASLTVVPLVEPIRPFSNNSPTYPNNINGETGVTEIGNQISVLSAPGDYVTVHTVVGESGHDMTYLNKTAVPTSSGGHAYPASLFEVKALTRLAAAANKTYGVGAIILTHGENDSKNQHYEADMYQLLKDYNSDIAAITKQSQKVILITTQQQTGPQDNSGPYSILAEWKVGVDHPGEAVCAGPKYQYEYGPNDHVHLTNVGYEHLGEKYAEVFYETVVLGHAWQPLQPLSAARDGAVIAVRFHVPNPPLVWDTKLPTPHQSVNTAWSKGHGFEVANQGGEVTIAGVAIQGDSVLITLASPPDPNGLVVRYAYTQDDVTTSWTGGTAKGRIGHLRDSDPLIGYTTKLPNYNYAVTFEMAVK